MTTRIHTFRVDGGTWRRGPWNMGRHATLGHWDIDLGTWEQRGAGDNFLRAKVTCHVHQRPAQTSCIIISSCNFQALECLTSAKCLIVLRSYQFRGSDSSVKSFLGSSISQRHDSTNLFISPKFCWFGGPSFLWPVCRPALTISDN